MKKEKTIIIKDSRLRRIRDAFRIILRLWVSDVYKVIQNENKDTLLIRQKLSDLRSVLEKSICYCRLCGRGDQDMAYIPSMTQWICVECNSKRIYFNNLKNDLQRHMNSLMIIEFLNKLRSKEGIKLTRFGSRCDGYKYSRKILNQMRISKNVQDKFLELCHYYGGHCDCEILLNADIRLREL